MASTDEEQNANEPERVSSLTRRCEKDIPRIFGSEILKIRVGQDHSPAQTFLLHKDIATQFSDFLAAASRSRWREGIEGIINLPEEEPQIFKIFEAFVYTGRIYSQRDGDEYVDASGVLIDREYGRMEDMWLLADRLQASDFKDAVVDALIEKIRSEKMVPLGAFAGIHIQSQGHSQMKRFLIDVAAWNWFNNDFQLAAGFGCNKEFFVDLAAKLAVQGKEGRSPRPPYAVESMESPCKYHEHGEDKACYRTVF